MPTQNNNRANFAQSLDSFVSTQNLSDADKAQELELRPSLLKALKGFHKSRFEMGEILREYRKLFVKKSFESLAAALGLPRRTAYDLLEDHAAVAALPESVRVVAETKGVDLGKKVNRTVLDQLMTLVTETGLDAKSESEIAEVVGDVLAETKATKKANRKPTTTKEVLPAGAFDHSFVDTFISAAKAMGWDKKRAIDAIKETWVESKPLGYAKPVVSAKPVNTVRTAVQVGA